MEPQNQYLVKRALADAGCLPLDVQQLNIVANVAIPLILQDAAVKIEHLARECAMLRNRIDVVYEAANEAKTRATQF